MDKQKSPVKPRITCHVCYFNFMVITLFSNTSSATVDLKTAVKIVKLIIVHHSFSVRRWWCRRERSKGGVQQGMGNSDGGGDGGW